MNLLSDWPPFKVESEVSNQISVFCMTPDFVFLLYSQKSSNTVELTGNFGGRPIGVHDKSYIFLTHKSKLIVAGLVRYFVTWKTQIYT